MAGVKISALPAVSAAQLNDLFAAVQGGVTSKVTLAQMLDTLTAPHNIRLATTANLNATYNNGSSGVGATLTNAGALAALSIDGVAVGLNNRILVKNQSTEFQNGIYDVTTVGDGATAWVMTRSEDYNLPDEIDLGDFFTVGEGSLNGLTQWIQTAAGPFTIGVTAITFESNVVAGTGVTKTNNIINVSGSGFTWNEVTGTSGNLSSHNGYILNNAALVTMTLPATFAIGDTFAIVGKGAGGWRVAQNASQLMHFGNQVTTTGAAGSLSSSNQWNCMELVGITANTTLSVRSAIGNITVV